MNTKVSIERSDFGRKLHEGLSALPSAKRFTPEQLEVIYALAYAHVAQGQYAQALPVFAFLSQYGPTRKHYLYGLALCLQMLSRLDEAIHMYSLCATLFPESVEATLRIAECQIAAGQREEAGKTLGLLLRYAEAGGGADLAAKAKALLNLISKEASA
jgi:type III secretion system low calcium response chaperone LcrH/SycD